MIPDLTDIESHLRAALMGHCPPLRVAKKSEQGLEVCGTFPVMQGKQKVDGHYFASIVPKPKDIRLYFFPIYTHADQFNLSPELRKMLKGKSCFHIRKLDDELSSEIASMIDLGIHLYRTDELI